MEPTDDLSRIKELEKKVRTLERKLSRSETDRQELEKASELREVVLENVIRELEESKIILEDRGDDLEATLTNLKTLQVKLVESEKMSALGVLVAGIAHEINNPVSFIYGNVSYAKAHLQDLLRLVHLYHYPNGIQLIREYSPLPPIACYPGALNQVFLNIIVNAIDSLEERVAIDHYSVPTICIRTEIDQEKWVKIAMADNALGMNETVQSKLFDPFFTTKQVGKGTGLGLAIARQIIVEQHQGFLGVSSVVGKGSEFTIKLPLR